MVTRNARCTPVSSLLFTVGSFTLFGVERGYISYSSVIAHAEDKIITGSGRVGPGAALVACVRVVLPNLYSYIFRSVKYTYKYVLSYCVVQYVVWFHVGTFFVVAYTPAVL